MIPSFSTDPLHNCLKPHWVGDGECDDATNIPECVFDGGDCCGEAIKTTYCSLCQCFDQVPTTNKTTTKTSTNTTTTMPTSTPSTNTTTIKVMPTTKKKHQQQLQQQQIQQKLLLQLCPK